MPYNLSTWLTEITFYLKRWWFLIKPSISRTRQGSTFQNEVHVQKREFQQRLKSTLISSLCAARRLHTNSTICWGNPRREGTLRPLHPALIVQRWVCSLCLLHYKCTHTHTELWIRDDLRNVCVAVSTGGGFYSNIPVIVWEWAECEKPFCCRFRTTVRCLSCRDSVCISCWWRRKPCALQSVSHFS